MSKVRTYLVGSWQGFGEDRVGPLDLPGHAVTPGLRAALPECDDEELEYVALTVAAQESVLGLRADTPSRRLVVVVDAEVEPRDSDSPSAVTAYGVHLPGDVVAYHVDDAPAARDVRPAWLAALEGARDLDGLLEACEEHELQWYDASELHEVIRIHTEHTP